MGSTLRTKRLGALLQAELGELLQRRIKDPRLKSLSITAVDVSPDLRQAKVYYSLWENQGQKEVEKAFKAAAGFLRRELASRMHLKVMPRLVPVFDTSLIEGARMSDLIDKVRKQDEQNRVDDPVEQEQEPK